MTQTAAHPRCPDCLRSADERWGRAVWYCRGCAQAFYEVDSPDALAPAPAAAPRRSRLLPWLAGAGAVLTLAAGVWWAVRL